MYKMKWTLFVMTLTGAEACWLYSKDSAVQKIENVLATKDRASVNRVFIHDMCEEMPKVFSWAVEQIGVESAFEDCDSNKDGTITLKEMRETDTCLSSCTKLAILNMVL